MIGLTISLGALILSLYNLRKYTIIYRDKEAKIIALTQENSKLKEENERLNQKNIEFSEIICGLDENVKVTLKIPETIDFIHKIVGPQALLSKPPTKEWLDKYLKQYLWVVAITIPNEHRDELIKMLDRCSSVKYKHWANVSSNAELVYYTKVYLALGHLGEDKIKYCMNNYASVHAIDKELNLPDVSSLSSTYYKIQV